jgi:hypothetical protein
MWGTGFSAAYIIPAKAEIQTGESFFACHSEGATYINRGSLMVDKKIISNIGLNIGDRRISGLNRHRKSVLIIENQF